MRYTVAVDLGKTKVGVAVFYGDTLKLAFTSHSMYGSTPEDVAFLVMASLRDDLEDWATVPAPPEFVCEWPMKYPNKRITHKDLESLYLVGNAIGQLNNGWTKKYTPGQWKGNVPKPAHHRRLSQILTDTEHKAMRDTGHDAWDAVGIGLFYLGRTKRGGVR